MMFMRIEEHSFKTRFSADSLCDIFNSEVRNKPTVGIDRVTVKSFSSDLRNNAEIISRKVFNGSYRFTNYSRMLVPKGPDTPSRELCVPTVRDKVTLKALSRVLDDVFAHSCMTAQPQQVIDEVKKCISSGEYDAFLKLDIKGFYSNINHDLMMASLKRNIRNESLLSLIMGAISTPSVRFGCANKKKRLKGVPEGLSISNRLANIFLIDLDDKLKSIDSTAFFRYVDDILIFCKKDALDRLLLCVKHYLELLNLDLNDEKTKHGLLLFNEFDYLGYTFHPSCLSVSEKARRRIEQSLELHLSLYGKIPMNRWLWRLNLRITGCRVTEDGKSYQRYGWLYYYSRSDDLAYFAKLDYLLRKIAKRRGILLPAETKSFKKAYYEIRYREGKTLYIPSFDYRMSVVYKREILENYYGIVGLRGKSEEEIEALFRSKISKDLSALERDAGNIS